jgi:hypothetical protein
MATPHSRKNSRVFRSPDMSEAVPQAKIKVEVKEEPNTFMDIDADDEEAGTILMALAQDSERRRSNNEKMMLPFYDEKVCIYIYIYITYLFVIFSLLFYLFIYNVF